MRLVLSIFVALALCGCKSETKVEKAPAPTPEEQPLITEETKATDDAMKVEMESICAALKACWAAGEQCNPQDALKKLALKSPYASGLRDRLISSGLDKKTLEEFKQNARGLGAKCDLEK